MDAHELLALHRAAVEKIDADPQLLRVVRARLAKQNRTAPGERASGLQYWEHMLVLFSWAEIRPVLTGESDEHRSLRAASPFPDVLTEEERAQVLKRHAVP